MTKNYKVKLFGYHPSTLFVNGGGETMLMNTFMQLKDNNINVELFDIWQRESNFDIFHLFGSNGAVAEVYTALAGADKKLVVSAIDYSNMSRFKLSLLKYIQKLSPLDNIYKQRQKLFDYAEVIIANSKAEKKFLLNYFNINERKIEVIPVGVSSSFYEVDSKSFVEKYKVENYILTVGRISKRKQQIKIIKTLKDIGLNLIFIGREDPSDLDYFIEFKKLVEEFENVHWIGQLDNDSLLLASAYSNARVHVLPSDPPEFPGISSLEAAISGTKVVTTKSPTVEETLLDYAFYCEPTAESILKVTRSALESNPNEACKKHLYENYTWEKVTERIINLYKKISI